MCAGLLLTFTESVSSSNTSHQAGLVAESHRRAPMSEFDQRRADDGMGRTERQRARRSAKVLDSAKSQGPAQNPR